MTIKISVVTDTPNTSVPVYVVGPRGLGIASEAFDAETGIFTWTMTDGSTETVDFSAIIGYLSDAEAARDLAQRWSSEVEDTPVTGSLYSALHHAAKSAASAAAAATALGDVQTIQTAINTVFDNFDDRFLGAFATADEPTTDNDGDPLLVGAIYWNTDEDELRFWNSAAWESPEATATLAAQQAVAARQAAETAEANAATSAALSGTKAGESANSAAIAVAAANALIGADGIMPTGGEILWPLSVVQTGPNALGYFDTGARLLSGVSERALLRFGEDTETLNFLLGFPVTDGFFLDFPDETTIFSDAAWTTAIEPGDSLGSALDKSGNEIDSSQSNAALRGKYGEAPKVVRNLLVNTATLATQNATVTDVEHALSFKGTGTVTLSGTSTAGPLVGTGADDRVSLAFTPTAGTLTLTASGSVTEAQLEIGALSDYQDVGASNLDVTEAGVPSYGFVRPDLSDDVLPFTIPAIDGDIVIAGRDGTWIEPAAPSAGTFEVGPTTYTGGTPGILSAVGDIVGMSLIDKTLTEAERQRVIRYYQSRGAKGLLVPGPELVANGTFDTDTSGWTQIGVGSFVWDNGTIACSDVAGNDCNAQTTFTSVSGRFYEFRWTVVSSNGGWLSRIRNSNDYSHPYTFGGLGDYSVIFMASVTGTNTVNLLAADTDTTTVFDNISVKELRPEEDW